MKSWIRIILVSFVLIGGTTSLGYWAINQFNNELDGVIASSVANTQMISSLFEKYTALASTSPEISAEFATSTDETLSVETSTSTIATTPTTATSTSSGRATSPDLKLSFTFPQKGSRTYIGCTYQVPWEASTIIHSLETALVDAGTTKPTGPITSGLAKENALEENVQNLSWKVGNVWPGAYYIKVSKVNGVEAEFKSRVFEIHTMPQGLDEKEKNLICGTSGN